ncbi:MAG: MBL fold metallo-hydrolase [Bacteroidales bacterium]|jgi:L-ascorbate metabolism protein UlaG (beta-lactamase superfamily)
MKKQNFFTKLTFLLVACLFVFNSNKPESESESESEPEPEDTCDCDINTNLPKCDDCPGTTVLVDFIGNTGFLITSKETKILIDQPTRTGGNWGVIIPSATTVDKIRQAAEPYDSIDLICISHKHADHYNVRYLTDVMSNNPDALLILPPEIYVTGAFSDFETRLVHPDIAYKENLDTLLKDIQINIACLKHHRPDVDDLYNYCYLFDLNGFKLLHMGAANPYEYTNELENIDYSSQEIDLAILHYLTVLNTKAPPPASGFSLANERIEFINTEIAPASIIFDHTYTSNTTVNYLRSLLEEDTNLPPGHVFSYSLEKKEY